MHHIHARLTGEAPWGWRDARVLAAEDQMLQLEYLSEPGQPRVWHHAPLAPQCPPGNPVRLHERFSVLGTPAGWIHVVIEDGIGPLPVPENPELWAAERTQGAVNLATGTGLALDHPDEEER